MAGNVTASLIGDDLVIEGDAESNAVSIVEGANDGEFLILGGNDRDGMPTGVNGTANGAAGVSGVTGDVIIRLYEGDDDVGLAGIDHPGDISIETGPGDDEISAVDAALGELDLHLGDGQNVVTLARLDVSGNLTIHSGYGPSSLTPNTYLLQDCAIGVDVDVDLGARAGAITVSGTTVGRDIRIENGDSSIVRGHVYSPIPGYAGIRFANVTVGGYLLANSAASTLFHVEGVFTGGGLFVHGRSSSNAFYVMHSRAFNGFSVSTVTGTIPLHIGSVVSGYDHVELSGVISDQGLSISTSGDVLLRYSRFAGDSKIDTYYSDDTVIVDTVEFGGALALALGTGDNTLEFRNSSVAGTLSLLQGANFRPITPNVQGSSPQRTAVMTLANNRIGALTMHGGDHTDIVQVLYCDCGVINAAMRAGSDSIRIEGTVAHGGVRLDGASDFDVFFQRFNYFAGLELLGFEAVY
jgi:hypothetical protein